MLLPVGVNALNGVFRGALLCSVPRGIIGGALTVRDELEDLMQGQNSSVFWKGVHVRRYKGNKTFC